MTDINTVNELEMEENEIETEYTSDSNTKVKSDTYLVDFIDKKVQTIVDLYNEHQTTNMQLTYEKILYYMYKDNDIELMQNRKFQYPNDVVYALKQFQYIMYLLNEYNPKGKVKKIYVHPSKELFCFFIGISTDIYDLLLNHSTSEIRNSMRLVEDYLIDSQFYYGNNTIKKLKLQASGNNGHGIVTQKEQLDINKFNKSMLDSDTIKRKLEMMRENKAIDVKQ